MRVRTLIISLIFSLVTVLGFASTASAQSEPTPEGVFAGGIVLTSTTTGAGTTTIGGIVLTVYLVTKDGKKAMKRYMRDNAVALRGDISRGGGGTVADLAEIFGVPEEQLPAFALQLRKARVDLMGPIADDAIADAEVDAFINTVWAAVARDAELLASIDTSRLYPG